MTAKIGFSLKQIRADSYTAMTDDAKTPDVIEKYKYETGMSYSMETNVSIDSSTVYRGSLDLFGTFDNPRAQTVMWRNELQINIWSLFGISIKANLIYDQSQMRKTQYKQSSRLGLFKSF